MHSPHSFSAGSLCFEKYNLIKWRNTCVTPLFLVCDRTIKMPTAFGTQSCPSHKPFSLCKLPAGTPLGRALYLFISPHSAQWLSEKPRDFEILPQVQLIFCQAEEWNRERNVGHFGTPPWLSGCGASSSSLQATVPVEIEKGMV